MTRADVSAHDGLVRPGGVADPDALRSDAVASVRAFVETGKPVAAVCRAAWTRVEADVVRGRRLTSWPSLRTDLRNAGAQWADEPVVVDTSGPGPLIISRTPGDREAFDASLLEALAG